MTSSPRAVPFLPDDHPYFLAYHFPAMTRCDADHHKSGWRNYQRAANTRLAHQGEPQPNPEKAMAVPNVGGLYGAGMHDFILGEAELGTRAAGFLDEESCEPDWFVNDQHYYETLRPQQASESDEPPAAFPADAEFGLDRGADAQ